MPIAPPSPPAARAARVRSVGWSRMCWDALVAVALGAALLVGVWLDVSAYRSAKGKIEPAFRLVGTPEGDRVGWNEFLHETSTVVHLGDIGRLEQENPRDRRTRFRWALGPVSTLEIWSEVTRARVEFRLRSPVADQTVTVACNGRTLEEIHLGQGEEITRQYAVELHPDSNRFTLTFGRYVSHGFEDGGGDKRPLAAKLLSLDLFLPNTNNDF